MITIYHRVFHLLKAIPQNSFNKTRTDCWKMYGLHKHNNNKKMADCVIYFMSDTYCVTRGTIPFLSQASYLPGYLFVGECCGLHGYVNNCWRTWNAFVHCSFVFISSLSFSYLLLSLPFHIPFILFIPMRLLFVYFRVFHVSLLWFCYNF